MPKRRRSRESALRILYQWDIHHEERRDVDCLKINPLGDQGGDDFSDRIVKGVVQYHREIDVLIERYSENWRLNRIAPIDRTVLRMAIYELLYCEDIPAKVTLNEAVELGKEYGSEDSSSFINGILDRILNEVVKKPFKSSKR